MKVLRPHDVEVGARSPQHKKSRQKRFKFKNNATKTESAPATQFFSSLLA
jgi:hypothetical protein